MDLEHSEERHAVVVQSATHIIGNHADRNQVRRLEHQPRIVFRRHRPTRQPFGERLNPARARRHTFHPLLIRAQIASAFRSASAVVDTRFGQVRVKPSDGPLARGVDAHLAAERREIAGVLEIVHRSAR